MLRGTEIDPLMTPISWTRCSDLLTMRALQRGQHRLRLRWASLTFCSPGSNSESESKSESLFLIIPRALRKKLEQTGMITKTIKNNRSIKVLQLDVYWWGGKSRPLILRSKAYMALCDCLLYKHEKTQCTGSSKVARDICTISVIFSIWPLYRNSQNTTTTKDLLTWGDQVIWEIKFKLSKELIDKCLHSWLNINDLDSVFKVISSSSEILWIWSQMAWSWSVIYSI